MEKLKPYFIDLKCTIGLVSFLLSSLMSYGQGNCLLYPENSGERKACELSYKAIEYPQGSAASQMLFDSAISIGPRYAYAYYQKSVPYFKHGLLSEGIQLLNKAIELDPRSYLCYRAYWYFSHLSYAHCIADLERYYSAMEGQMAFTPGGDMEMRLLLAVSYAKTGDLDRGINTILQCIGSYELESHIGLYDHYILGVLYYENGDMQKAAEALENQIDHNPDYAGSYYYLGLVRKAQLDQDEAQKMFEESLKRLTGKLGGYNVSGLGYNVSVEMVESEIIS